MNKASMQIGPRQTEVDDGHGYRYWYRVMGETVFHFSIYADTGDGWSEVVVKRHPYGRYQEQEVTHRWLTCREKARSIDAEPKSGVIDLPDIARYAA